MFKLIIILKPHCLLMRTCKAAGRPVHAARVPLAWLKRRTLSVAQAFSVVPCLRCCPSLFRDTLPPFLCCGLFCLPTTLRGGSRPPPALGFGSSWETWEQT